MGRNTRRKIKIRSQELLLEWGEELAVYKESKLKYSEENSIQPIISPDCVPYKIICIVIEEDEWISRE